MNRSPDKPRRCNADFPVGAFRRLGDWRYRVGEMLPQLWETILALLAPPPPLRRYRVAPRANPAAFRYAMLRGIQLELRPSANFSVGDNAGWKTGATRLSSVVNRTTT